jgi:hypothetical protein
MNTESLKVLMNTKTLKACVSVFVALLSAAQTRADSAYFQAVTNLHPVAYWPLQETAQPPRFDVETNYGSLGPIANAYYASTNAVHGFAPGAINGDSDAAVNFLGNGSSFAIVPTTDNRISLKAGQPFSVECWARATGGQNYVSMVNQTGHNGNGGLNNVNSSSGWILCQNYSSAWTDYNVVNGNHPAAFTFHVFNGIGNSGGAEYQVANNNASAWLTGGATGYQNVWVYLCGVFDGTNTILYMYSTNLDNVNYGGTNLFNGVIGDITTGQPTAAGVLGAPVPGAQFVPDTWDPIFFGCNRGYGANPYHGCLDEVAIYTNALSSQQILNHFMAGTNGLGQYVTTVLGDNPLMYWRMNAPQWTYPPMNTFPVAANYGSAASRMTNFNTGASGQNSAVYQTGTLPGVAGPSSIGFGSMSNACAFNGLNGAVDVGYNTLLDPLGVTNNFTVIAWFKGNPMDNNNRWNCLASHSDSSWKMQFQNGNTKGYKGAGPQPNIAPGTFNVNDGKWHMFVLESTYTNGVSTNVSIYLDSGLVSATAVVTNLIPGKPTLDAFLGGAPDPAYVQPTNEATYNTAQQFFAGQLAHLAYFTNALSISQIRSLYFTAAPAPAILTQPVSGAANQNGAYTNTVVAGGQPPLSYRWYRNYAALANQTNASLVLNPVQLSDQSANYFVIVTNSYGAATSAVVSLSVVSNLVFLGQSPNGYTNPITLFGGSVIGGTNYLGSSPTFSVSVMGALPINYQWRTNGVPMAGANNASFTFTNCQMTSPTSFDCILANSYGQATSMVWSVVYTAAPTAPFPQAVLAAKPIAYWRLNEPDDGLFDGNPGAICNDYQSGNNGIYTNVYLSNATLGTGYNPTTDPNTKAAEFGIFKSPASDANSIGTNIDFSVPAGGNAEFTVAVWANGNGTAQQGNGGLVTKGYFFGEEFTLDEGSLAPGAGTALRFSVRGADGTPYDASSTIKLANDSNWHFIVGVCDEANSSVSLYIDGLLATNITIPAGSGIINSAAVPLMLGARSQNATAPGNNQFKGLLNDAAIFNYAMTHQQVANLFGSAGVPPFFVRQPVSDTNVNRGGTLIVPTTPAGSAPLSYQWYDLNSGGLPVPDQTNATLVISNILASDTYFLTVTNTYGTINSSPVNVNVVSGIPQIYTDVNNPFYALPGGVANNSVLAYGTAPLTYQWQYSNSLGVVSLADNGRISGSQSNALAISSVQAADAGGYQVVVANSFGSVTSSLATLIIPGVLPVSFYGNGSGWSQNGSARFAGGTVTLTDPSVGGTGSYFFQVPQYVGAFVASFTYQAGGNMAADGVTFCLQNDVRGTGAIGGGGGALAYQGIQPSVALELNIFAGNGVGGVGYSFDANGAIGPTVPPGSVAINSGDPITVIVGYVAGQLSLTFTDAVATTSFSTNLYVGDITQILGGNTAYVGFTGAFGGLTSIQTVSGFQFISLPSQTIQLSNGTNAVVSWPGSILGYVLQQKSSLTAANWLYATNQQILSNGLNQVTVPKGPGSEFYRLILQP